ncbi:uncharacterized protein K460DRAFT_296544 [Cucurbitaria berberidis CBS 394.84]|uniref:J domain-containing protein n=1 Tax=Cucurbitaria berberidis CBS 394.84 TaxID=1168544 RepID=A0A9P4G7J7_9PLEO|nr:uncharacterized protein K460DRAFT_296544 [Cucurbitaria berberidis CBS 394.84]KAF1840160.1 hypothetical protein K460DRAFT_296544 [Cucurbitaria berberidis CBS 394.84]
MASYRTLGVGPNASEDSIRAAYKALALQYHPDKVDKLNRAEATVHELEDGAEDLDWRGKLPEGIGGSGTAWWDALEGNEPGPVKRWAKVSAKAQQNVGMKVDATARFILNAEYQDAYEGFENWRRKHIEKRDQEERLQNDIDAMSLRLRDQARATLAEKRSAPGYQHDDYQQFNLDEEQFFEDDSSKRTGTWRDNHNTLASGKIPVQQRYTLFKKQVSAIERRLSTFDPEFRTKTELRRCAKSRN